MIAQPNRHYKNETLRQLLDESLPRDQAEHVESHLSQCITCRHELEHIAGEAPWWEETVAILSERTVPGPKTTASIHTLDASIDWIRPLLDDSSGDGVGCIDKYPIHGVIGQGGMGVVIRGTDPELNRPVAIKVLSPHLAGVGAARARFMREAQSAASVVHPSIVPIYSVVTSARLPYIVMPCIHGGNLQQRIDREGPLDLDEILRIGLQVADGLAAAHRHGVIHRDIKPANILIEEGNGRALISDFGLARALDDATLTISGMIAGTPQYMSPEQARGEPIDARSDLFSLGSLLYALSTGRPPFRAESPLVVLRKITETNPRAIGQINERMPGWFANLVARLMQKDVGKRPASADVVASLLREAQAHVLNPTSYSIPKSLLPRRYRGRILAAAIGIPLLSLGTWSAQDFLASRPQPQFDLSGVNSDQEPTNLQPARVETVGEVEIFSPSWREPSVERELLAIQMTLNELATAVEAEHYPYPPLDQPQPSTLLERGEKNE